MKINNHIINTKIRDTYLKQTQAKKLEDKGESQSAAKSQVKKKDEIVLSSRAAEVRKFQEIVRNLPDIRQDKVDEVKSQIDSGQYQVKGRLVINGINNTLV
ncbi:flagellar biosynthesis anti-sigma factor FlgM [Candidatus Poribacteria bacterium]|nr:flagellar biosynthesis anti-sigma factor FlgM [Candidatus Poribacteria bacterium]